MDFADLHMHSLHSDGEWTPRKLVRACARAGLGAMALTDHDDLSGSSEAIAAGREEGVEVLTGVELSSRWHGMDLHLLGYGFDPSDAGLRALLARAREDRRQRAVRMTERLGELGVPVAFEEVERIAGDGTVGRPHVARALVEAGHVRDVRTAFDLYLGDDRPACVEKMQLAPADAVNVLRQAGGVAVVAHPVVLGGVPELEALLETGVDGVEVRHRLHGKNAERTFEEFATAHGLLRTGGSDFHGPRPGAPGVGDVSVPLAWWEELVDALARRGADSAERTGERRRGG